MTIRLTRQCRQRLYCSHNSRNTYETIRTWFFMRFPTNLKFYVYLQVAHTSKCNCDEYKIAIKHGIQNFPYVPPLQKHKMQQKN